MSNYYSEFHSSRHRASDAQRERNRDRLADQAAKHRAQYEAKYPRPGRITRLIAFTGRQITRLNVFSKPTPKISPENLPPCTQSEFAVKFSD